jgi:hypothetical protein
VVVCCIDGRNQSTRRKTLICCKSVKNFITYYCIEYISSYVGFEHKNVMVIGTACTCSCKSNYHTITTTTVPYLNDINIDNNVDSLQVPFLMIISLKKWMKVQIVTDHLFLLTTFLYGLNLDSKYKWRVKISSFIATICLKGLLINKGLVPNKR